MMFMLITAFRDGKMPRFDAQHQEVIDDLMSLQESLTNVLRFSEAEDEQADRCEALLQAACQCQNTITITTATYFGEVLFGPDIRVWNVEGFFENYDLSNTHYSQLTEDEIAIFRARVEFDKVMISIRQSGCDSEQRMTRQKSRTTPGRDAWNTSYGHWRAMELIDISGDVIRSNVQVFQAVLIMQRAMAQNRESPGQIWLQKPVYFVDALGRQMILPLEIVSSFEMFTSILEDRFKDSPAFNMPWETIFRPGQRIEMSLVVDSAQQRDYCPRCHTTKRDFAKDDESECPNCVLKWSTSGSNSVCQYIQGLWISLPTHAQPLPTRETIQRLLSNMKESKDAWPFLRSNEAGKSSFATMQTKVNNGDYDDAHIAFLGDAALVFKEGRQRSYQVARCSDMIEEHMWKLLAEDPEWPSIVVPIEAEVG
ncbi:uncharacterized protein PAC_15989 [Phialocephala subalpina]|uniref:Ubiquitin-like domain-containing protein n=1 Tax=Phialocephala subalpina TaxID=576137 RepID=A0A1L7XM52_9HELO|nr:uncharacterized protein PAC_15989 [Phialocephala subalpina]